MEESSNSEKKVKEGWLYKKRGFYFKQWKQQWIVLTFNSLYVYDTKNDDEPKETIQLSDIQICESVDSDNNNSNMVITDNKDYKHHFKTANTTALSQWIHNINGCIRCVNIPIVVECKRNIDYSCDFDIDVPYTKNYKYSIYDIIMNIMRIVNNKYKPMKFEPVDIVSDSCVGQKIVYDDYDWKECDVFISDYPKDHVIRVGFHLSIDFAIYEHKTVSNNTICQSMKSITDLCPIYAKMRYQDICTEQY
eukprot:153258_1